MRIHRRARAVAAAAALPTLAAAAGYASRTNGFLPVRDDQPSARGVKG